MPDNNSRNSTGDKDGRSEGSRNLETDGGVAGQHGQAHRNTDYLSQEVNLLKPSTPFMRDHLRIVWTGFAIWVLAVWGPVTLTYLATDAMTTQMPVLGFPLHYFLVAFGAPTSALILSFWYSRKRDALDEKYGIDHATVETTERGGGATAADGGADE
ncbi:DUF4212 domain-containing protein [Halopiger aswanensis]|uniref:Putative solute:sodium symporter small subunit n=1 Tax=Halopiger aswanensis TaxID=148449 RepID=A0A419WQV9_9EURY|nr:putative solute:sodium symporter small subunit [Halopiger aswanensis]